MAAGEYTESEKPKSETNGTTTAEQKEAEAMGKDILQEVRSTSPSNSSSEEIPTYQKRNKKREMIYISIAVVLGLALIGVLVYFSVTNALKEEEPSAVGQKGVAVTTTTEDPTTTTTTTEATTTIADPSSGANNQI